VITIPDNTLNIAISNAQKRNVALNDLPQRENHGKQLPNVFFN
jgi:hypothetical protein